VRFGVRFWRRNERGRPHRVEQTPFYPASTAIPLSSGVESAATRRGSIRSTSGSSRCVARHRWCRRAQGWGRRTPDPHLSIGEDVLVVLARVGAARIGVVQEVHARAPLDEGALRRREGEVPVVHGRERPPDDVLREQVQDDGEEALRVAGDELGGVPDPFLVRAVGAEVAAGEVRGDRLVVFVFVAHLNRFRARAFRLCCCMSRMMRWRLTKTPWTSRAPPGRGGAVGPPALLVRLADENRELLVLDHSRGWRSADGGLEPGARDLEDAAQHRNRGLGHLGCDQGEPQRRCFAKRITGARLRARRRAGP
jgi:hypothetical protein